ncbi:immunoglobulin kappa light chain-like [Micropterus salmoides]|uniref:immunoglobulin kappa light chain-like n=1 Tax=Micropterus salmoides TaxID=27706 RepID=UPI0018ECE20D|nr:immunoglobulin kappa light chain-like [Micropterus salmoides]
MHLYTILLGVFHLSAVIQSSALKQDTGVISARVGDNVTLHCFYDSQVAMHFSWYRQTLGSGPELLSSIYKYDKPSTVSRWTKKNPRFSVQRKEGMNHLHISDVHLSDSATYYCGSSHSNIVDFGKGVFLSVKGVNIKEIVQGPTSETILKGGSVTFNCTARFGTCDGEHSVYWFRHGSRQAVLHALGEGCKQVSTSGPPSLNCVYHLQKMNLTSSDAGTYYCAVASCGEILFGNGSKLLIKDDVEDQAAQITILVWLSIIRTGLLLFFLTICFLFHITKRG